MKIPLLIHGLRKIENNISEESYQMICCQTRLTETYTYI